MNPVVGTIWDIGIAVGPVVGYVYQYFLIRKRKSVGTFSINLCGMLLFCNILRIGFYFSNKYAQALLVQSILMIVAQIFLLHICVKSMNLEGVFDLQRQQQSQQESQEMFAHFWRWKQFRKYLIVIFVFTVAVLVLSLWFNSLGWSGVGQLIGYLSLISESLLMLPQIKENYKQKRVKGLSHLLVALNFIGDIMKFGYFIVNNQPTQFFVCGVIQIVLDFTVILQIVYYARLNKGKDAGQTPESVGDKIGQKPQTDEKMEVEVIEQAEKPPGDYNQLDDQKAI